jgi:LPS sulfotransferase NodH
MAESGPKMPSNERHRWQFEFEDRTVPVRSYLICSMQRSGTELLSHMLAGTMLAGVPHEYLRNDLMARLKGSWRVEIETFDDYLRELTLRKTSPNGVFGLKALWNQYRLTIGDRDPTALFPNPSFVHLRREDRVRQAVSWIKARQSGRWISVIDQEVAPPEFDRAQIESIVRRIERGEAGWDRVFDHFGITPYRLTYEELAAAPAQKTKEVLEFVGVELPAGFQVQAPVIERQADALSDQWVARYREESGSSSSGRS